LPSRSVYGMVDTFRISVQLIPVNLLA
jgi:hypothetical protein